MQSRMDEFKKFVSSHNKLKDEVRNGKRTWQNIYEEWVLYGEDDPSWNEFLSNNGEINKKNLSINMDNLKNVLDYLKKINPDDLNKTLNTIQKVIQIAQTVGLGKGSNLGSVNSVYNDWWD